MDTKITIQSTVHRPLNKVWGFYTEPEHITQWNFATDDWHCPHAENQLKPGGKYRARMEAKDGSSGFDFEADYDEIVLFEKIVYTLRDGRQVSTTFHNLGDSVKVTTVFEAEKQNPIDMQRSGWQSILDNFKKYSEHQKQTDNKDSTSITQ